MATIKHSPGPWEMAATGVECQYFHVKSADGLIVGYSVGGMDHDLQTANAKLLAAAPELLAFLKEALLELWRLDDFHGKLPEWYVTAENLVQSFEVEVKR